MTAYWLILTFGLTFIGAACNAPAWWRLTLIAFGEPTPWRIRCVRLGLSLVNLGVLVGCWVRASLSAFDPPEMLRSTPLLVGLHFNLRPIFVQVPPQTLLLSLLLIFLGEVLMLASSGDALRAAGRSPVCLRAFIVLAPVWLVLCSLWRLI